MNSFPPRRICLITPGHISTTPRLIKEADALVEAGHHVHVVSGRYYPSMEPLDQQILQRVSWTCTRVSYLENPGSFLRRVKRKCSRWLISRAWTESPLVAADAHHAHIHPLARAALLQDADFYLGHCLAGLAAAGLAAEKKQALLGFDIEDIHGREIEFQLTDAAESCASRIIQSKWIPRCHHLTASSGAIAEEYQRIYGKICTVIHNVFPMNERPADFSDPHPATMEKPARLYWFSQVIGPQRGLEDAVAVTALMKTPVELHLRGLCDNDYKTTLSRLASDLGLKRPLVFHPLGDPARMAVLAAPYDLGLSLELTHPPNRNLCLTNKVFCYLMAGIPQWLSRTSAQDRIARELGTSAISSPLEDHEGTAHALDDFFSNPDRVHEACKKARLLAETRFCWDKEKLLFLDMINKLT